MPASVPIKQEEEALVFAQGSDKKTPSKPKDEGSKSLSSSSYLTSEQQITNVCCKACGKLVHTSSVCPDTKPSTAQIHAISAAVDDASDASDKECVIILAQFSKYINGDPAVLLTQEEERQTINPDLVLLDSQSTVDLFTNPAHVQNIRPA
jgi:hypothetical protein